MTQLNRPSYLLRRAAVVFAAALSLASLPAAPAADAPPAAPATQPAAAPASALKFSTDRVVIFKDGYGLVAKTGVATADADGRAFTADVPDAAVLGSFWAIASPEPGAQANAPARLLAMEAGWDEKRELRKIETDCLTVPELLRANIGKSATLGLPDGRNVVGTIADVLDLPPDPKAAAGLPVPQAVGGFVADLDPSRDPFDILRNLRQQMAATYGYAARPTAVNPDDGGVLRRELVPRGGEFVVIDEPGGSRLVLPVSRVQTLSGKDLVTKMTREEEVFTRTKRLSFDFGKDSAGKQVRLQIFYFTPGLRWIPTYRVAGELKDKADLALQGEVLNEVEDFANAAVDLVVGVPHFRFKDAVSPLTLEAQLRRALAAADFDNNRLSNGNFLNAQYLRNNDAGGLRGAGAAGPAVAPTLAPELAGASGEQDLFLYSLKQFSLKRGGRAAVPLWQQTVPLRHLYTMDLRIGRGNDGSSYIEGQPQDAARGAGPTGSPLKVRINQVWHQIELTNDSTVPWTTGAAITMRNHIPIGQDLLTYTPVRGATLLPLTIAVDILGAYQEEELARKHNALTAHGHSYTFIQKKGTITLSNFRKERATTRVTLSLGGKVEAVSDDGKIRHDDFRGGDWQHSPHHDVNGHSDVSWNINLEPGENKTLHYTVSFYAR